MIEVCCVGVVITRKHEPGCEGLKLLILQIFYEMFYSEIYFTCVFRYLDVDYISFEMRHRPADSQAT